MTSPLRTTVAICAAVVVLVVVGAAAFVGTQSGSSLVADATGLARLDVDRFGGDVQRATATGADGRAIALARQGGRLTPRDRVLPGARITVKLTVKRPGWDAWALGKTHTERVVVTAPTTKLLTPYVTTAAGGVVTARFDRPVSVVAVGGRTRELASPRKVVTIPTTYRAGSTQVAAAARPWEDLGKPTTVSWFPPSSGPVAVVSPAPDAQVAPGTPIRLRFSVPVSDVLGSRLPTVTPALGGHWRKTDGHTLFYTPSGGTAAFGTSLKITLPKAITVAGPQGGALRTVTSIAFKTPPGSTLRLQQLLADAGYLPLDWKPTGAPVPRTETAELRAAAKAPEGQFIWRYSNTPHELVKLWKPSEYNTITRGAIMKFQDRHQLTVDALAGPQVWNALIKDAIARSRLSEGYSYVYVHRDLPQKLTLWHAGHTVLTSPGNTGVPAAPTQLGSFPVFEHVSVTTMSGTNPDGSKYNDPGIKWVSYFNGGDALHTFNRASFGTPQSLGCVELPEKTAERVYPYTPIGTLVTIEH